ncbi:disease resistance protein RGA4-like [Panicum virgatum]|uniref:NB-ARC domain-containing protein n=1 Tax=Panicum virgatum TaxID=38727 RepID=A0A8T0PCU2_PANVG|nr:disease resistance protein RGA4-like [Panicum virgatum]XP_039824068.1 disease resistance protein RGA4-like [Panicum virgatum]KAG2558778.1 hypothetical protein PVAP13_8NG342996 [Panicum virgatum]
MEAASGLVKTSVDLFNLLHASYQKLKQLPKDVDFIQSELRSIEEAIIKNSSNADQNWTSSSWIADLKLIRQKIEDAVDFYNYRVICKEDDPGVLYGAYHSAKTFLAGPRSKLLKDIMDIKQLISEAKERKGYHRQDPPPANHATTDRAYQHANEANPQGLETPKGELIQLLRASSESSKKLRVIAISGLGGTGKTILAKEACNQVHYKDKEFDCCSWVTASTIAIKLIARDVNKLLVHIFDKLEPPPQGTSNHLATGPPSEENISEHLRQVLENKRYIIRIDDLQMETGLWMNIQCAFPDNNKSSRIIVTTTNDKLAQICSLNCRVLRMQPLDMGSAHALLERELPVVHRCPTNLNQSLEMILKSCECHPLAIVNMACHIRETGNRWEWDHDKCEQACNGIGSGLVNGTGAFVGMSQVLNRTYSSVNYNTMTCLLSLSTYPKNHVIKRKSLIRRWLAERLITCKDKRSGEDILNECFTNLVEHNFIIPVKISISGEVKAFRVHQMMLQFIKAKANSENFVTWIHIHEGQEKEQVNNICRLYIHNSSPKDPSIGNKTELSRVRSLTFSGLASKTLMNFKDFKLLRVLDLECCENLKNANLDTICRSSMLKYISIRGNEGVSKLPPSIVKLQYLETLDIRETKVDILAMEVIKLPQLAHLFGEFQIPSELSNLETLFTNNISNLHTLVGFCIDESPAVVKLLPLMLKLMKVKILCRQTTPRSEVIEEDLLLSLKSCFQRKLSAPNLSLGSLCIDFSDVRDLDFLHRLEEPSFLHSLKLRGKFSEKSRGLPRFILLSDNLKELHLSGTNLGCSVLSLIQGLQNLQFLKLTEDISITEAGEIICECGWFVSLKRLCFDVPVLPKIVIREKAMESLKSLQLFCIVLGGFSGITHLLHLEELVLPSNVTGPEADDLALQVSRHPMRPKFDRPLGDPGRSIGSKRMLTRKNGFQTLKLGKTS